MVVIDEHWCRTWWFAFQALWGDVPPALAFARERCLACGVDVDTLVEE